MSEQHKSNEPKPVKSAKIEDLPPDPGKLESDPRGGSTIKNEYDQSARKVINNLRG